MRGCGWMLSEVVFGSLWFVLVVLRGLTRDAYLDACGYALKFSLMCVGECEERGLWCLIVMLG